MDPLQLGLLAIVGIAAGFLNVMAGGGSLLTVPIMLFMDIPAPIANGTNRIAILAQNITAVITFFRRGFSEFKLSFSLTLISLPGAIAGALLGTQLEGEWFNRLVAVIMIAVMIIMALENKGQGKTSPSGLSAEEPSRKQLIWGHALMVGAGFWGGFIQLGVGFLIMPILHRVMGLNLLRTNMHKVFIIGVHTCAALIIFASQVEILWVVGLALAVGTSFGGWMATRLQLKKGEGLIKTILYSVLIIFVIKLLLF
jgi:uncharacterized protein